MARPDAKRNTVGTKGAHCRVSAGKGDGPQDPPGSPAAAKRAEAALIESLRSAAPLAAEFYLRPAPVVARDLLGKTLVTVSGSLVTAVTLVEVEAYVGVDDPASHTHRGPTPRNRTMFERGGFCYVYLSYGMHCCMNVVTGPAGRGEGVLLRAGAPLAGANSMAARRGLSATSPPLRQLTNGPGKLTQALGIGLAHNGHRYDTAEMKIVGGAPLPANAVAVSGRIGISKGTELQLRFFVAASPYAAKSPAASPP